MYTHHPAFSNVNFLLNHGIVIKEIKIGVMLLAKPQIYFRFHQFFYLCPFSVPESNPEYHVAFRSANF